MHNKLVPFLAWSVSQGIHTPLELSFEGSYRFMALPADDSKLLKMVDSCDDVNVVKVPLDACILGEDSETLVERLKYEKKMGSKSKFGPWIDVLPTIEDFQDMPRFWNSKRLEFVSKFDGGQLHRRMKSDIYDNLDDQWAWACADSRSNLLPDLTCSLSPLLDMFNHRADFTTKASVDEVGQLLLDVTSVSLLKKQEGAELEQFVDQAAGGRRALNESIVGRNREVFISYGDFSNLEWLCNYGFIPPNNKRNIETLTIRVPWQSAYMIVVDESGSIDNVYNQACLSSIRMNLAKMNRSLDRQVQESEAAKISERNEEEAYALISGEIEEALYSAKTGVVHAEESKDMLVVQYLQGRLASLEKGLNSMKKKYPSLFEV